MAPQSGLKIYLNASLFFLPQSAFFVVGGVVVEFEGVSCGGVNLFSDIFEAFS